MKHLRHLLVILVALLPYCRQSGFPPPPGFRAFGGNPVLSPGAPGSWDELFVWTPQVINHNHVFYLFFLGGNVNGRIAIGVATSSDGYHYSKFPGNPILMPDNSGFDAFTVGPGIVLKTDSLWLMYYNAQDMMSFAPGKGAGRATAASPFGPWQRSETPVIASGSTGEWDGGFIIPSSVLILEDGSYLMYYSGGNDIASFQDFSVGMAVSADGILWKKHDDPKTTAHPFAESDPVLQPGKEGDWDGAFTWMANVTTTEAGFIMYYGGASVSAREEMKAIGYATSYDGTAWKKYTDNPVYRSSDDPFILSRGKVGYMENPFLLDTDTLTFLYYECGPLQVERSFISLATAKH